METRAFTAEDQDAVAGEIEAVVVGLAALVEAYDPQIVAFELFEGADKVDDAGDAKVLGRSRAGFDGDRAQGGRAALGEDYAIDPGAVGNAKQGSKVLGVFNAVEGEDQTPAGAVWRGLEEVFNVEELFGADDSDHALVGSGSGHMGELLARLGAYPDAGLAALGDELLHAGVMAFAGNEHVIETAAAGAKRLLNCVDAVENVHEG
jgi:hypothetical protein